MCGDAGAANPVFPITPSCWMPDVPDDTELGKELARELNLSAQDLPPRPGGLYRIGKWPIKRHLRTIRH